MNESIYPEYFINSNEFRQYNKIVCKTTLIVLYSYSYGWVCVASVRVARTKHPSNSIGAMRCSMVWYSMVWCCASLDFARNSRKSENLIAWRYKSFYALIRHEIGFNQLICVCVCLLSNIIQVESYTSPLLIVITYLLVCPLVFCMICNYRL